MVKSVIDVGIIKKKPSVESKIQNYVKDVDLFRDWLIVSKFEVVSNLVENSLITEKNEFGKIQVLKANGKKCDRCWHYEKETFNGIQNTNLCQRCWSIINLE